MAGAITKGYTFTSTEEVTHTKLHTLVDSATIANVDQTNIVANSGLVVRSAASPSDTDALHYDTDDDTVKAYDGDSWREVPTVDAPSEGDMVRRAADGSGWSATSCYVDRGDPATFDYAIGDLTEDDAWHDLDLSAIVGTGAKAVHLLVVYTADTVAKSAKFRKNGNSNELNISDARCQVANVSVTGDFVVALDTNGVIEYYLDSTETTACNILVRGWFF